MTTFSEYLAKTGLPEAALAPITTKVAEHNEMVKVSNDLISQINAANAQDPSKPGYDDFLDARWRANETDTRISEKVQRFDVIAEEYEKLLKELRDAAKENFIPQALSEDATKDARKKVNDTAPAIAEARKAIAAQLELIQGMLTMQKVEIPEGGLVTLLPTAESLKNTRGRKAATADGIPPNKTRVGEILIDDKSTNREGKGKLDYAAEVLSDKWNAKNVPANRVTAEEIEEAYFASLEVPFRGKKSTELPDTHSFTFERTIKVKNTNDDSFTDVSQKVKVTVVSKPHFDSRNTSEPKPQPAETSTENKTETSAPAKKTPAKIDTRTEAQKVKDAEAAKK